MTDIIKKKNGFSRHYLYWFPIAIIVVYIVILSISIYIPVMYESELPRWLGEVVGQNQLLLMFIVAEIIEDLLSWGILPGPIDLYFNPIELEPPTPLGWFVGSFVILAGAIFINYLLIKIVGVFQSGCHRHVK